MTKQEFLDNLISIEAVEGGSNHRCSFNSNRINATYIAATRRYSQVADRDEIFSECCEILLHLLNKMDKDTIAGRDVQYLSLTMEKRLCDYVNRTKDVIISRKGGKRTLYTPMVESLDKTLEEGGETTLRDTVTQCDSIFHIDRNEENRGLNNIMDNADLTNRQREVIKILDTTEDTENGIYNQAEAARLLGCSRDNVNKVYKAAARRIESTYVKQNTRRELIESLEAFVDSIDSEEDVIDFITKNKESDCIGYILYSTDIDSGLIQKFNRDTLEGDNRRVFCTQFLSEVYKYLELLEYNDKQSNSVSSGDKIKKSKDNFVDNIVYRYIVEDKATKEQRKGRYEVIDGTKYYYVGKDTKKGNSKPERKTEYKDLII